MTQQAYDSIIELYQQLQNLPEDDPNESVILNKINDVKKNLTQAELINITIFLMSGLV